VKTEEHPQEVRKTKGGAILDPDDLVKDVLDDNDYVSISWFILKIFKNF